MNLRAILMLTCVLLLLPFVLIGLLASRSVSRLWSWYNHDMR